MYYTQYVKNQGSLQLELYLTLLFSLAYYSREILFFFLYLVNYEFLLQNFFHISGFFRPFYLFHWCCYTIGLICNLKLPNSQNQLSQKLTSTLTLYKILTLMPAIELANYLILKVYLIYHSYFSSIYVLVHESCKCLHSISTFIIL